MTQDMTETLLSERDINSKIAQGVSLGALREKTASTHTLPILIEYAWSMPRVWLEAA